MRTNFKLKMKRYLFISFILSVLILSQTVYGWDKLNIDILKPEINEVPIFELAQDQAVKELGGPTSISFRFINNNSWQELCYEKKGLKLVFEDPAKDPKHRCIAVYVSLYKQYHNQAECSLEQFDGVLTNNISAQWNVKKVFEVFKAYHPADCFDKAKLKAIEGITNESARESAKWSLYRIIIQRDEYDIFFDYNPETKYLEGVDILKREIESCF